MVTLEILHPITDGATSYEPGTAEKPTLVTDPSPRLLELAEPGNLHLGKQIARVFDAKANAKEVAQRESALAVAIPSLDRVREAAALHGMELVHAGSERQFQMIAEDLHLQLHIAQDLIAELRLQLEEQTLSVLANDEPEQVDNADMLAAVSSVDNPVSLEPGPAEDGDLAEAAAPLDDSPKKRGR